MSQVDLNALSITELKAMAYDLINALDVNRQNLQVVNNTIINKMKEQPKNENKEEEIK